MTKKYSDFGVSIANADSLVDWLKVTSTRHKSVKAGIGGYAAIYDIGGTNIVTSTDGVGTKAKLAADFDMLDGIGVDLVAMNVNDICCTGARPLLFLDYFATGKIKLEQAKRILTSIRKGCSIANIPLVGGETAEMPGIYRGDDFDIAGFAVGLASNAQVLEPCRVDSGMHVVGLHSSGFHSNGYSVLRSIFERDIDLHIARLMTPTVIYSNLVTKFGDAKLIAAAAHITGGGWENIYRVTDGKRVDWYEYRPPEFFEEATKRANFTREEAFKTFNMGIGMMLIVEDLCLETVLETSVLNGFEADVIGRII